MLIRDENYTTLSYGAGVRRLFTNEICWFNLLIQSVDSICWFKHNRLIPAHLLCMWPTTYVLDYIYGLQRIWPTTYLADYVCGPLHMWPTTYVAHYICGPLQTCPLYVNSRTRFTPLSDITRKFLSAHNLTSSMWNYVFLIYTFTFCYV